MEHVRWGILGTASIARRLVIPAIQLSDSGTVVAVASRELEKAEDFAAKLNIPRAFGSYRELIDSPTVDAVYIPLTNDLHLHWILEAIKVGKHVLCEKPITLNASEVQQIQAAAEGTGLFVMEGIVSHFHPVHQRARELALEGVVGDVHLIRLSLAADFSERQSDFRWKKELGGGGLLDLGCYCIRTARFLLGTEPTSVSATGIFDQETDVDINTAILLKFDGGVTAMIDCGILSMPRNVYEIIGAKGKIVVETPFGYGTQTRKLTAYDTRSNVLLEEPITAHQVNVQMETVSKCILLGSEPPVPLTESYQNMRVVDACMSSARSDGSFVALV